MRCVRFLDEGGDHFLGCELGDGEAELVTETLQRTGLKRKIHKRLAPVVPSAILCIGLNYKHHAEETGAKIPDQPVLFMKNPAALNHPNDPIVIPPICFNEPQIDYECELAVVIGRAASDVPVEKALDYVLGYTVGNDVSARWWQKKGGGGQWVRGKSFNTFCPIGPVLVTADELEDPQNLQLSTKLNGEQMQSANTGDMIFSVAQLISILSQGMTLLPQTVILTGTPSGVGFARQPPVFLQPGDTITVEIDRIGSLTNPVMAG